MDVFCSFLLAILELVSTSSVFIHYCNRRADQYDSLYTLTVKRQSNLFM